MRNVSIDLLKIISIYFVILSHVCLCFFEKMPNDYILNLFRQSGQLGVSLFYMCSGYFLLNKKNSNMVNYFLIKSKKISFVLLVWLTIYYFYDKYFVCKYIKNCDIFFYCFFNVSNHKSEATHLWFLYSIIPIYIVSSFYCHFFNIIYKHNILKLLIIMLIISNLTFVNELTLYEYNFLIIPNNFLSFFQNEGIINFLLGGYIGIKEKNYNKKILLLIGFVSFFLLSYISKVLGISIFYGKFYNVLLILSSLSFFCFFLSINSRSCYLNKISENVFGIYLIHNLFVIEINGPSLHYYLINFFSPVNIYIYILIYSLISMLLSLYLCILFRRNKISSYIISI
ncbi:acyltransferase [Arsenophonus nasoniae]|uniref:acyltransferase n=1 Tax=Arsenophonus nasoniae TaxID=638 RepID=UPI00387A465D